VSLPIENPTELKAPCICRRAAMAGPAFWRGTRHGGRWPREGSGASGRM